MRCCHERQVHAGLNMRRMIGATIGPQPWQIVTSQVHDTTLTNESGPEGGRRASGNLMIEFSYTAAPTNGIFKQKTITHQ
jgi:hypothetical protein